MKNKFLLLLVLFLFLPFISYAQNEWMVPCDMDPDADCGTEQALQGGLYKPSSNSTGQYFRALIVFAKFAGDTQPIANWPLNGLPSWSSSIINQVPSSQYTDLTISDYFKDMSNQTFDFIGDIHPNLITVQNNSAYWDANASVLSQINSQISNFKRYDNWKYENGMFVFDEGNGDGYLDMLIVIYRYTENWWFRIAGGVANLGCSFTTHDGIDIDGSNPSIYASGITSTVKREYDSYGMTLHFAHEFGHYLFGASHTRTGGLMAGYPWDYCGETYAMSSWERAKLGYIDYHNASYNGQVKTLTDFVTTGDVLKINIPFDNPNSSEYLLLENHQRISSYDRIISGGILGGNPNSNLSVGKGLYVYHVTNGHNYPPTIKFLTADGSWDWTYAGMMDMPTGWPAQLPKISRGTGTKRYLNQYGEGDRNSKLVVQGYSTGLDKWLGIDPLTKNWEISRDVMGDETDAFVIGYNRQMTPWSNPSTSKFINGSEVPSNISFRITAQTGNNIEVQVYNNQNSALSLPPSKPQNLRVTIDEYFPCLEWEHNLEPDMKYSGKYKIYRATSSTGVPTSFSLRATINAYLDRTTPVTSWIDEQAYCSGTGSKVFYYITAVDNDLIESEPSEWDWAPFNPWFWKSGQKEDLEISDFVLFDNYPNPFNPSTKITYTVPEQSYITIKVFNSIGQEVVTLVEETKETGVYSTEFSGLGLPSGIYICKMIAMNNSKQIFNSNKKMLLIK